MPSFLSLHKLSDLISADRIFMKFPSALLHDLVDPFVNRFFRSRYSTIVRYRSVYSLRFALRQSTYLCSAYTA